MASLPSQAFARSLTADDKEIITLKNSIANHQLDIPITIFYIDPNGHILIVGINPCESHHTTAYYLQQLHSILGNVPIKIEYIFFTGSDCFIPD